jgi:hypothetical protein
MALQAHLAISKSRGFVPTIVYTNMTSVFRAITQAFLGVEINIVEQEIM